MWVPDCFSLSKKPLHTCNPTAHQAAVVVGHAAQCQLLQEHHLKSIGIFLQEFTYALEKGKLGTGIRASFFGGWVLSLALPLFHALPRVKESQPCRTRLGLPYIGTPSPSSFALGVDTNAPSCVRQPTRLVKSPNPMGTPNIAQIVGPSQLKARIHREAARVVTRYFVHDLSTSCKIVDKRNMGTATTSTAHHFKIFPRSTYDSCRVQHKKLQWTTSTKPLVGDIEMPLTSLTPFIPS